MKGSKYILLSFDVEEFDLPLEYGFAFSADEQMQNGKKGLDAIDSVLSDPAIECTLFTTARFAIQYPDSIRNHAEKHEIASHTFFHSEYDDTHLLSSRTKLEEISGKPITGLRMPRMRKVNMEEVRKAGYLYDSSINPTWLPGRYNNLNLPRTWYTENRIIRVPTSVSPLFRLPLFWLSFKNIPYGFYKKLALQTLQKDGYLCLYFHPWEFISLAGFGLPAYVRKKDGDQLLSLLNRLLLDLKKEGECISMHRFLKQKSPAFAGQS